MELIDLLLLLHMVDASENLLIASRSETPARGSEVAYQTK